MILIDKEKLLEAIDEIPCGECDGPGLDECYACVVGRVRTAPAVNAVKDAMHQIKCERDTALDQLAELGYELGEKIEDDVRRVVRCKDCYWFDEKQLKKQGYFTCRASAMDADEDCYCSMAERKEVQE